MAKKPSEVTEEQVAPTLNANDAAFEKLVQEAGGVELSLDRNAYVPAACGGVPIKGFVIDCLKMPPAEIAGETRDWNAFLILLTAPTKVRDRNGDIVEAKAGSEILLPETWQLKGALARYVHDVVNMHEIVVMPKAQIDVGGGQKLWTYRLAVTKGLKERGALYPSTFGQVQALENKKTIAQLAAGSVVSNAETGEVAGALVGKGQQAATA